MLYFVEIQDNKITGKGTSFGLNEGQKEVSEDVFSAITNLPATFDIDGKGNIINVVPAPITEPIPPEPTEIEILKKENENLQNQLASINSDLQGFMDFYFTTL